MDRIQVLGANNMREELHRLESMTAALVGVLAHRGCEAASLASFEMMFVDLEGLDLRFQSS
jgi:hypothetical protein